MLLHSQRPTRGASSVAVVSHAPHERGAVSLLSLRHQPSYSLDQAARLARRIAGLAKGTKARSISRGAGTARTRAAYVRLDWTCGVGLAPPSCCVVLGVTVAATSIHGRASPLSSASRSLRVPWLSRNCACVLIWRACSRYLSMFLTPKEPVCWRLTEQQHTCSLGAWRSQI